MVLQINFYDYPSFHLFTFDWNGHTLQHHKILQSIIWYLHILNLSFPVLQTITPQSTKLRSENWLVNELISNYWCYNLGFLLLLGPLLSICWFLNYLLSESGAYGRLIAVGKRFTRNAQPSSPLNTAPLRRHSRISFNLYIQASLGRP